MGSNSWFEAPSPSRATYACPILRRDHSPTRWGLGGRSLGGRVSRCPSTGRRAPPLVFARPPYIVCAPSGFPAGQLRVVWFFVGSPKKNQKHFKNAKKTNNLKKPTRKTKITAKRATKQHKRQKEPEKTKSNPQQLKQITRKRTQSHNNFTNFNSFPMPL